MMNKIRINPLSPSGERAGFTLFEILVSIAIIGLILTVVIGGMDRFLENDMKAASNKMAATIRYLYNKAATEGLYLRLMLDLKENTYWVEATTDPVLISRGDEKTGMTEKEKAEEEKEAKDEGETAPGEIPKLKPRKPVFSPVDSFLLKPKKLPDNIFFKDVYVEHRPLPVDSGKVGIYFFPNGYVESAIVNLRDEDDEVNYSIKTNPINGRVSVENTYRSMEGR